MTKLRLEPLTEAHQADLEKLLADAEVLRFTRLPDPPVPGYAADWIARYRTAREEGRGEAFAAVDSDGTFLGVALAPHLDRESLESELGYMVATAARGRGVASEMLRQLTTWAFTEHGILRATLAIDVANVASQRVAVRAGYTLEGVLRSSYFKQGMRVDTQVWSRLPTDPEPDEAGSPADR
ncbi:GNAT family N-acetyltransferase [Jatrophihabitans sp.]|uniref:GNAT family N-acetyltransferase n=1 Tax=Jatrophihabitans sp. TaxID=1932789 RepID=UPI002C3D29AB|nr:GNAT family N-acetyltransferase [Jatrophihabitans sp.]